MRIRFTKFDLEESDDCIYDYVRLNDGMFGYSPLIGPYCGKNTPPPLVLKLHEEITYTDTKNIHSFNFVT